MKNQNVVELVKETKRIPTDFAEFVTTKSKSPIQTAAGLDQKCMTFGWKLSPELLFWAEKLSVEEIQKLDSFIESIMESLGLTKHYNPFFKNFEEGGFHFSEEEIWNLFCYYGKITTHSFQDYEKEKEKFTETALRNFVILNLGSTLKEEIVSRVKKVAESSIPLSANDLAFIAENQASISDTALKGLSPTIKENAALLNKIKYDRGLGLSFSTSTDLLRFVVAMNSGDITLTEKTKFKNFPRKLRRTIFSAIESLSQTNPNFIVDALSYREEWKRIGEKLHPHESKFKSVKTFFNEVREDTTNVKSVAAKLEEALASNNKTQILSFFKDYPSLLGRNLDRVLRNNESITPTEIYPFYNHFSSKVIISLIQHLRNREAVTKIYINKKGKSFCEIKNFVKEINPDTLAMVIKDLKQVLSSRIKSYNTITLAKELETVAMPMSDKLKPRGIGILPIGSETKLSGTDVLRFFIYWHQKSIRTDYDLSTIFLDEEFKPASYVAFTRLGNSYATHSGDITSAPNGASEFIDIKLNLIPKEVKYIVPQVNVFSGESFDETTEVFFGFMERNESEKGLAFEPRTVKFKSELQGKMKVSLPVMFMRNQDNTWTAKWMQLSISSSRFIGMVEKNSKNTSLLVKAIAEKDFFKVGELIALYKEKQVDSEQEQLFVHSDSIETENSPNVKCVGQTSLQDLIP